MQQPPAKGGTRCCANPLSPIPPTHPCQGSQSEGCDRNRTTGSILAPRPWGDEREEVGVQEWQQAAWESTGKGDLWGGS